MDKQQVKDFIDSTWESSVIPTLTDYITIPNKSPAFDPNWQQNGYMEHAVELLVKWSQQRAIKDVKINIHRLPERTPIILIEIPGDSDETVLLYGHLDKQPEMEGWQADLGPWKPVRKGDKLYGRGAADDGYAIFSSLLAIEAIQRQRIPHARCIVLIEACEESGSVDLPYYIDDLRDVIGEPDLVICLDSGCGNYDQLWCTTSLRGVINANLKVQLMIEGVHSGNASGIVADTFRVLRQLLNRVDDINTGEVLLPALQGDIPDSRIEQARTAARILAEEVHQSFPLLPGAKPMSDDPVELVLNRTWRAMLSITGIAGIPSLSDAGNVLRPQTTVKLSMRTPPTCHLEKAIAALKQVLEANPPYGAKITFTADQSGPGWDAPEVADWLHKANQEASQLYYGKDAVYMGEGGSIPFMGMLGEKFPKAQFLITGLLGPASNAHGPNEFLHIPMAKKLTCCVSHVIAKHYEYHAG